MLLRIRLEVQAMLRKAGFMTEAVAGAIADLINQQNQLNIRYTPERVLAERDSYIVRMRGDEVVGVVEVKKVQWYQCEISHLSVQPHAQGAGLGTSLVAEAERRARDMGSRIAQCTIRVGNVASEGIFTRRGFAPTATFRNERTGNEVRVYQKVVG
jgi:ribosomal protein S18 acetylase RimI-like enzyme